MYVITNLPKGLMFVMMLNICLAGHCQFKNILDSILHQPNKLQADRFEVLPHSHLHNPLGPTAQLLRKESYAASCEEGPEGERGFWIRYNQIEYLYKNETIYLADENTLKEIKPRLFGRTLNRAVKTLRMLERRSPYAKNIIQTLQQSENKFVLSLTKTSRSYTLFPLPNGRLGVLNNNAYAFQVIEGEKLIVEYAPFDKIGSGAEIRWTPKQKKICLAHELGHAYDANFGLVDDRLMHAYGEIMPAREIRALFHENMIRKDLHRQLRKELTSGSSLIADGMPFTYPLPVPARY
ncbi:hypothetical protein [Ekhidna sp.]|uniref:hypothetical protein n=1 Tax=Ekhidna sp. TaxID=2608089 RepID=UPI003513D321